MTPEELKAIEEKFAEIGRMETELNDRLRAENERLESLQAYTIDRLNEAIRENYGAPEIETSKPGMGDIRNAIQRVVNGSRHGGKSQGQRERESLLHEIERLREALREGITSTRGA